METLPHDVLQWIVTFLPLHERMISRIASRALRDAVQHSAAPASLNDAPLHDLVALFLIDPSAQRALWVMQWPNSRMWLLKHDFILDIMVRVSPCASTVWCNPIDFVTVTQWN